MVAARALPGALTARPWLLSAVCDCPVPSCPFPYAHSSSCPSAPPAASLRRPSGELPVCLSACCLARLRLPPRWLVWLSWNAGAQCSAVLTVSECCLLERFLSRWGTPVVLPVFRVATPPVAGPALRSLALT
eukprot:3729652-Prymnesium_polylepis.1